MTSAFIVAGKRTPFGAFGGSLKNIKAAQLGGHAAKAALAQLPENTKVDSVFFGGVLHSDNSVPYLARHVSLLAGLPIDVPCLTVNRLCGSGFQTLINGVQEIRLGEANVVLTGGTENMSNSPYTLSGASRWGNKYGVDLKLEDSLAAALVDQVPTATPMGITAENLSEQYGISRQDADAYALQSQQRWAAGNKAGAFKDEIAPISVPGKKRGSEITVDTDESPRASTTLETLARLPTVFKKDGTVTAGNASGITDGASANIVASEEGIKRYGLTPLVRIAAYQITAVEPSIMGIGPVSAIQGALERANLKIEDIDIFDVNEAFASQWLSVQKALNLPIEKSNMFGGAIALGHPLAASGARILNNLTYNLHRLDKRWAVGAACIGGGQGIAVVLERI
ncbi:MAG: hypothetical protein CYPHOPRED_005618 [Cyphobasidiales sp. Tagirdzhanova-0007]|nr:MAG: hypothetical protein CYPHOPRED_005618 [Cyphobasidiales sp. Tagirdzhanova-0007]